MLARSLSLHGATHDGFVTDAQYECYPCEHCAKWVEHLELHHRKYRSRGGDWSPANVIGLCNNCHRLVTTDHTGWAEDNGLAVHSWQDPAKVPVVVWYADVPVFLDADGGWSG